MIYYSIFQHIVSIKLEHVSHQTQQYKVNVFKTCLLQDIKEGLKYTRVCVWC